MTSEQMTSEQWIVSDQPFLHGAISTGNIWQFGQFDRSTRAMIQDVNLYRVPADLVDLLQILVCMLNPDEHSSNRLEQV